MMNYLFGYHRRTDCPAVHDGGMHSHNFYEIYCMIAGNADYCVEGSRYHLQAGDIILMRKGEVHKFQLLSTASYERIYIHFDISEILTFTENADLLAAFDDRPLGKYNHYQAELFPDNPWQEYLRKICSTPDRGKQICYLLPLLGDLAEAFATVKTNPPFAEKDRASPIINYINANLSEELSLDMLTTRFFISKTHLNRVFKQSTGTTVWDYIRIKRLFLAKELICSGCPPTDIYQQCGFKDYTTFFRAYKQHYGISPKNHIK